MRIKRQRETFAYRLAADNPLAPFMPQQSKGKNIDALPKGDSAAPYEAAAAAEAAKDGPRAPKFVAPGFGSGSSAGSNGGSGSGTSGGISTRGVGNGGHLGDSGGSIRPETQSTLDWIKKNHPEFGNIGGYRAPDGFNEHSSGSALDVMLPAGYDTSQSGAFIKDVFNNNPSAAYILYDNRQWNPDGTSSYGISSPHTDHFHIRTVM